MFSVSKARHTFQPLSVIEWGEGGTTGFLFSSLTISAGTGEYIITGVNGAQYVLWLLGSWKSKALLISQFLIASISDRGPMHINITE